MADQTGPKRTTDELRTDRKTAVWLAMAGYSEQAIANLINDNSDYSISRVTVHKDIKAELEPYRSIAPTDLDTARLLQIKRLEEIKLLAVETFLETQTETIVTTNKDGNGNIVSQQTRKRKRSGDAKFLNIAKEVEIERSKILGVYAPEREEKHGELTVTFAWSQPAPSLPDSEDGDYKLLDNGAEGEGEGEGEGDIEHSF